MPAVLCRAEGTVNIAVRPEDVCITDDEQAGVAASVKQRILRGHYQELVLAAPFGQVRAFVSNEVTSTQIHTHRARCILDIASIKFL